MAVDSNWIDDLERLQRLKDAGGLTDSEFKAEKERILSGRQNLLEPNHGVASPKAQPANSPGRPTKNPVIVASPTFFSARNIAFCALAVIALVLAAGGILLLTEQPRQVVPPPSAPHAKVAPAPPRPAPLREVTKAAEVDTSEQMRRSGWSEGSPDGDGCLLERIGERANGLNHVFIYEGERGRVYELSFSSTKYPAGDDTITASDDSPLASDLAVVIDGRAIPSQLQNHFGNYWEVEVALTQDNYRRLIGARSIALALRDETLAMESLTPNATSAAAIARCLRP